MCVYVCMYVWMDGRKEGRETMEPCSFHLVPHFLKECPPGANHFEP